MPNKSMGAATVRAVIYIGSSRYQFLSTQARELSYLTNSNIRATTLIQYLVDEFMATAREQILNNHENQEPHEEDK
ncbi:TPA: hypothetical protein ACS705_003379 [Providencia alcalifaciens]